MVETIRRTESVSQFIPGNGNSSIAVTEELGVGVSTKVDEVERLPGTQLLMERRHVLEFHRAVLDFEHAGDRLQMMHLGRAYIGRGFDD